MDTSIINLLEELKTDIEEIKTSQQEINTDIIELKNNQGRIISQIDLLKLVQNTSNSDDSISMKSIETAILKMESNTNKFNNKLSILESIIINNWKELLELKGFE